MPTLNAPISAGERHDVRRERHVHRRRRPLRRTLRAALLNDVAPHVAARAARVGG